MVCMRFAVRKHCMFTCVPPVSLLQRAARPTEIMLCHCPALSSTVSDSQGDSSQLRCSRRANVQLQAAAWWLSATKVYSFELYSSDGSTDVLKVCTRSERAL